MPLDATLYFNSEGDGAFGDTTPADLTRAVAAMSVRGHGVIHLHGGVVNKNAALGIAERLRPKYEAAGAHPLFAVWESGIGETIANNLGEIKDEKIFRILLGKILKWAVGKLRAGGAKAANLPFPNDLEILKADQGRKADVEPFAGQAIAANVDRVSDEQRDAFILELQRDPDFVGEVRGIVLAHSQSNEPAVFVARAALAAGDGKTRMNPEIVDELRGDNQDGQRAVFSGLALAKHAAAVLFRVVKRFASGRHHGVYATVVEELLREVYLDDAGALVWGAMKRDTEDTFIRAGGVQPRAGWTLVDALGEACRAANPPRISVVAHSAGSIYACHLLRAIAAARADANHPLPADFRLANLVFLAPAVRFDVFAETLDAAEDCITQFRMFGLRDELEAGYWEVPVLYPRSLLYLVSGVAERDGDDSDFDCPLLGMQRYHDAAAYPGAALDRVRTFLAEHQRTVWAKAGPALGLSSDADRHGGFDEDVVTMASVAEILR